MGDQRGEPAEGAEEGSSKAPPRGSLLARVARVSALLLVFLLLGGYAWLSRVEARVDLSMLETGGRMLHSARGGAAGPRPYRINGERIVAATGHLPHRLRDALRYGASLCGSDGWSMESLLTRLRDRDPLPATDTDPSLLGGVLWAIDSEHGDGEHGYFACLGEERRAQREREASLARYAQSGDLSELGGLRYLYLRREGRGSRYAAVWSEGPFRPAEALRAEGEVGGADLPGLRRPAGAERRFSFAAEDGRDRVVHYWSEGAELAQHEASFREQIREDGFLSEARSTNSTNSRIITARGRGRVVTFVITEGGITESGGGVSTIGMESAE